MDFFLFCGAGQSDPSPGGGLPLRCRLTMPPLYPAGACPPCRLLTLPLACFIAPSPRPALAERSSRREGGDQGYFMQGASPLASPALDRLRHLQTLPKRHPVGGLLSLSPAVPAVSCLCRPHPPAPLPLRGRGRPRLFHARGFAPCIPGLEPGRHWGRGRTTHPAGLAPCGAG